MRSYLMTPLILSCVSNTVNGLLQRNVRGYDASVTGYCPGIAKLGMGYDFLLANPLATGTADPGFMERSVFELAYTQNKTTPDDVHWAVPDKTSVDPVSSVCSSKFSSSSMSGTHSYQASLDQQVKASVKGWDARFSASTDYQKVEQHTSSNREVVVQSQARCEVYAAAIYLNDAPNLSEDFLALAAALPDEYDLDQYTKVIGQYGTHVITSMHLGGRFGQYSTFSEESYTSMQKEGLNIEVSAGFSAWGVSADASSMTDTQKEQAEQFDNKRSESGIFTVGGDYRSSAEEWIPTVRQFPMPVSFELQQLDALFDTKYMPESSAQKQASMQRALAEYCNYIKSQGKVSTCDAPGQDGPIPHIPTITEETTFPENSPDNTDYHYLDRHDVHCGSGSALQEFKLSRPADDLIQYKFKCAAPAPGLTDFESHHSEESDSPTGDYHYLDRQEVSCPDDSVLSRFHLVTGNNRMHYEFTCAKVASGSLGACRDTYTDATSGPGFDYHYLDRLDVACDVDEALQKFQFHRPSETSINYKMTCCKLPYRGIGVWFAGDEDAIFV